MGLFFPTYGKIKKMFQTTNQCRYFMILPFPATTYSVESGRFCWSMFSSSNHQPRCNQNVDLSRSPWNTHITTSARGCLQQFQTLKALTTEAFLQLCKVQVIQGEALQRSDWICQAWVRLTLIKNCQLAVSMTTEVINHVVQVWLYDHQLKLQSLQPVRIFSKKMCVCVPRFCDPLISLSKTQDGWKLQRDVVFTAAESKLRDPLQLIWALLEGAGRLVASTCQGLMDPSLEGQVWIFVNHLEHVQMP